MKLQKLALLSLFATASVVHAADSLSEVDQAFFAKVSQGGMYEVKLAQAAEGKLTTQDLRDQANTESHDHLLVGAKLKAIVEKQGVTFPKELNAEFKARLGKITALSPKNFDKAYVADMEKIHDADGAAFLKESKEGTNPALKAFAAETYRIVQRHLGELKVKI